MSQDIVPRALLPRKSKRQLGFDLSDLSQWIPEFEGLDSAVKKEAAITLGELSRFIAFKMFREFPNSGPALGRAVADFHSVLVKRVPAYAADFYY